MKEAYDHYHLISSITKEVPEKTMELHFLNMSNIKEIDKKKLKKLKLNEEVKKKVNDYSLSETERNAYFKTAQELVGWLTKIEESKEEGRQEGREEGIDIGMEKGREEMQYSVIEALLNTNHSDEDIMNITKCDKEALELVKSKINS